MDMTIMRVLKKSLLIFFMMVMMLGLLAELDSGSRVYASIGSIDLTDGSVTITETDYAQNGTTYPYAGNIIITGGNTNNTVSVTSGYHNITLSGVNIDAAPTYLATAFDIMSGTVVNLTLVGENTLKSGNYRPGLGVPSGASLTITEASSGKLTANGGFCAAGIGGVWGGSSGAITISGGTVTANGDSGAGIGGGEDGSGGTTIISGGTVNATSYSSGAGIGGGKKHDAYRTVSGGTITISGGTVTATAAGNISLGSGIGNGYNSSAGTTIIISGGTVKATSISGTPKNAINENVYKTTLTLLNGDENAEVSSLSVLHGGEAYSFGGGGIHTDNEGKLYLYLPQSSVDTSINFTANLMEYAFVLKAADSGSNNGIAEKTAPNAISIAITTPAAKLTYKVGDTLDITGMVVTGTYSNGSQTVIPVTAANVSGFDSSMTAASQTLTVTVEGQSTTYTVVINPALTSIAITTPAAKLTYKVGESLDITGMVVTGTYSDGSQQVIPVTTANVYGFNSGVSGSRTLMVYVEGKSTYYSVVIKVLTSIAITIPVMSRPSPIM